MKFGEYKELSENGIKNWKHAGRDIVQQRRASAEADKEWAIHKLKKDGTPSGMHDAVTKCKDENEARTKAKYIQDLNPKQNIKFALKNGAKELGII